MHLLPKALTSNFFQYTSSSADFKLELEKLFTNRNEDTNLSGKFITSDEFQITAKHQFGPFPATGMFYLPTTIKGSFHKNSDGKTQINTLISPNSLYLMSFLLLPIVFLVIGLTVERDRVSIAFYALLLAIIIAILIVTTKLSGLFKKTLQDQFENYFKLSRKT